MLAKGDQGIEPDVENALLYFELSAEHDNRYAQYMLGLHFQHGLFMQQTPDIKHALYWYERASRHGFADAQVSLGQLILDNLNTLTTMDTPTSPSLKIQDKWIQLAIHWLQLAAKQKNVKAHVTLGGLYDEGELVTRNPTQAIQHYEAATSIDTHSDDKQVILAHYFVGISYRLGNLVPLNYSKALKHLELASKGDYAPAQRALGLMFLEGVAVSKNEIMAYQWFTKAAMQGDVQALGLLAQQAEQRGNSDADIEVAVNMYKQAALSGSVAAQLSLAHLLLRTDRRSEAFPWFQLAANNGIESSTSPPLPPSPTSKLTHQHDDKRSSLGKIDINVGHVRQRNVARLMVARYKFNGWDGVDVDRALAYQEFTYLSDQEQLSDAHFWVAACYDEGVQNQDGSVVVKRNPKKAFDYYMKSALGGDVDGQFHVALMLANGVSSSSHPATSVEKDPTRAFKWYTKAAERGHATAQYSLGLFYERGLSPVQSVQLDKAKFWYERASHQQHTTSMVALAQLLLQELSTSAHQDALHWLHTAATKNDDKNYTAALRSLASVFEQGKIAVTQCDPDRYQKGWLLLQKAADKQDPLAFVDMSRYHEHGLGVEKSNQNALQCLIQAEALGYQKARMAIAELYYRHKMWAEALASYISVAKSNVILKKPGWHARLAIANLLLVDDYDQDVDAANLMHEVFTWLSTMISQPTGDAVIMEPLELLGLCHELGKGTSRSISSAISYYKRVVNVSTDEMNWIQERTRFRLVEYYMQTRDYALAWDHLQITKKHFHIMNHKCKSSRTLARSARYYIGYLLLHSDHLETNSREAQVWLTQAADEGDGNAALELAKLHESTNDMKSAKMRLEQGVSASHSGCMVALALLLERTEDDNDHIMDSDIAELLERAIELDNTDALYQQGRLTYDAYLDDNSNSQRLFDTALDHFMKAAAKGNRQSMVRLGQIYDSLEQYDDAQAWFEQSSLEPMSSMMLIKYHLEGVADSAVMIDRYPVTDFDFTHLLAATETFWQNMDPVSLSRMDRHSLGILCFFVGQTYSQQDQTHHQDVDIAAMAEMWYHRSVDVNQHKDATHALGLLYEARGDYFGAMEWFRCAAEKWNHAHSQYQLGLYHAHGMGGLDVNLVAAQRYLKLAMGQGLEQAKKELGMVMFMHAWDLWNNQKHYQRGLKQYEKAATLVPEALVELGHLYHTGFASEDPSTEQGFCVILKSYKQAFSYYSDAAQQGNAKAALMIGSYYEEGYIHDMENLEEALKWYEKAYSWKCGHLAELAIGKLKHSMAERRLAEHDLEAALDLQEEAYTWFEGCVASSSTAAATSTSTSHWISTSTTTSQQEAEADQQSSHAKVMMALYHLKGWGRKPCDPVKGFKMLMMLVQDQSDDDNNAALVEVAMCYDQGIGVEKDVTKSLHYWELAAKIDDVVALRRTAEIYRLGLTGLCDLEKANYYGGRADIIERTKQNEREKSFCSTSSSSSSSSSSYASRRSSLNSLNQLY
ncbi:hypothetical protein BCR42DRAFT_19597 [Absidia repens]|uniref:Sel1 repeat protein n=1 Tax=Absidia repens TaxID=90262 RepID=A0A1X2J2Q0_9FUNG|nr:hypothetical protein BCR42DRAFT_19597 [Absidia repens]